MDLKLSGSSVVPDGAYGKGCEIDLVQYSEAAEISPDAKVRKIEKI